jgi:ATP-dependent metalloprotease FtsH
LQAAAKTLGNRHKTLSFETESGISEDEKVATIRLRDFSFRRAVDAGDIASVLDEAEKPQTRFSDVVGASEAKEELAFFVNYLKNPRSFAAKGLKPPKGVLLYGPPGTGKTLLARAMAGESDAAFIPSEASSFVTQWQGSGPAAVRELFLRARRYAPAVIFIDEIDAIGRKRGQSLPGVVGHAEEMTLNTLLAEMDGFSADPKRPVFVLAATNFNVDENRSASGALDPALLRRFDRRVLVGLPDKSERRQYLDIILDKHHTAVSPAARELIARRSAGMAPANLEDITEIALRAAVKAGAPLDDTALNEAFEVYQHGTAKEYGYEALERVARHEAGHAYLSYLAGSIPNYLTVVSRGSHGGYMESDADEENPVRTKDALLARIRTFLGGRAAEMVYYGDRDGISAGAAGDLEAATGIAKDMIIKYGMDETFGLVSCGGDGAGGNGMTTEVRRRIGAILSEQMEEAVTQIRAGRDHVDRISAALLEKNKLTKDEIEALLLCRKTARFASGRM